MNPVTQRHLGEFVRLGIPRHPGEGWDPGSAASSENLVCGWTWGARWFILVIRGSLSFGAGTAEGWCPLQADTPPHELGFLQVHCADWQGEAPCGTSVAVSQSFFRL